MVSICRISVVQSSVFCATSPRLYALDADVSGCPVPTHPSSLCSRLWGYYYFYYNIVTLSRSEFLPVLSQNIK